MKGVDRWSKQITKSLDELTKATFPNFSQVIAHRDRYRKWTKVLLAQKFQPHRPLMAAPRVMRIHI